MFEVGKNYEVELVSMPGEHNFVRGVAKAVEGTLLKLETDKGERVFNTAAFVCASVTEYREHAGSIYSPAKPPRAVDVDGWPLENPHGD